MQSKILNYLIKWKEEQHIYNFLNILDSRDVVPTFYKKKYH